MLWEDGLVVVSSVYPTVSHRSLTVCFFRVVYGSLVSVFGLLSGKAVVPRASGYSFGRPSDGSGRCRLFNVMFDSKPRSALGAWLDWRGEEGTIRRSAYRYRHCCAPCRGFDGDWQRAAAGRRFDPLKKNPNIALHYGKLNRFCIFQRTGDIGERVTRGKPRVSCDLG